MTINSLSINPYPSYASQPRDYNSHRNGQEQAPDASVVGGAVPAEFAPDTAVPSASGAYRGEADESQGQEKNRQMGKGACQTCKSRKYQDGSNDPGVSFKTPTKLSPDQASSAVRAHEGEHVSREQAAAEREDRKVVSQSVTYHSSICPECGRVYISGGTTRTVTKAQVDRTYGLNQSEERGRYLDQTA